ncbi:MAG: helix-turn-helix domain-containing protein [Thermodesulfobacteriota bacterium]
MTLYEAGKQKASQGWNQQINYQQLAITMDYSPIMVYGLSRLARRGEVCAMNDPPGDVLTIDELSVYLKIPKSTLYKLVREGKVPSQKIGRHWRFGKKAIDRWLEDKRLGDSD